MINQKFNDLVNKINQTIETFNLPYKLIVEHENNHIDFLHISESNGNIRPYFISFSSFGNRLDDEWNIEMLQFINNLCKVEGLLTKNLFIKDYNIVYDGSDRFKFYYKSTEFILKLENDQTVKFLKGFDLSWGNSFIVDLENNGMKLEINANPLDATEIKFFVRHDNFPITDLINKIEEIVDTLANNKPHFYKKETY